MSSENPLHDHPFVLKLLKLGATQRQLEGLRFQSNSYVLPFDQWAWVAEDKSFPVAAFVEAKPYCTLKWLHEVNPPPSRNRDQAWDYVAIHQAAPLYKAGEISPLSAGASEKAPE